jgi:hypothetical protein
MGMALVIAIAFELIVAVQSIVFLVAPLAGALIGAYANVRADRWRPMRRVFANAAYAAFITGVSLAVLYAVLRLVFVFADTGYRTPDQGGQISCQPGPECTYLRYVGEGYGPELAAAGVTDGASYGAYAIREQVVGGAMLIMLTVAGGLVAAGVRSVRTPAGREATPAAGA